MKVKKFIQPNGHNQERKLPSVAMVFNGKVIENEIEGYRTLTVSGRENIDFRTSTAPESNEILTKDLNARVIRVTYEMSAEENNEFQEKYRLLTRLLVTDADVSIEFMDDPNVSYKGQVTHINEIQPTSNIVIGAFEIYCASPWKEEKAAVIKGNPMKIRLKSGYDTKPNQIKLVVKENTNRLTVRNATTGRRIVLSGDYEEDDVIIVRIANNLITKNNQNIMHELNFTETDFHKFLLTGNDDIDAVPSSTELEMIVKARWL